MARETLQLAPVLREYGSPGVSYDDWVHPVFTDSHTLALGPGEELLSNWLGPILPAPNGGWGDARTAQEGRTFASKWTLSSRSQMYVTNERIVIASVDLSQGASYFGTGVLAPVALAASGVSAMKARARAKGRIAALQLRFEWLAAARADHSEGRTVFGKPYHSDRLVLYVSGSRSELECVEVGLPDHADQWFPWFVDRVFNYRQARCRTVLGEDHRAVSKNEEMFEKWRADGGLFETVANAPCGAHLQPDVADNGVRSTETFVYLKLTKQHYNWGTR